MKKTILFLFVSLLMVLSCSQKVNFKPRAINFDRDDCHVCRMGLTDQRYNVQAINEFGEVRWYDDIGCLAEDMRNTDSWNQWKGSKVQFWIGDASKENTPDNWIDARKAFYDYGKKETPMGYGYAAYAQKPAVDSVFTFEEVLERIDSGKTMREAFIKKKKMLGEGKCGGGKCGTRKCGGK